MPGIRFDLPSRPPEWRRSGPFLVVAVALHGLALAYPLQRALTSPATALPIQAHLASPSPAAEAAKPETSPEPSPPPKPKKRPIAQPTPVMPRPLETASASPAPASPQTAPLPAPTAASVASANTSAGSPAPSLTAARFNADYLRNPQPAYPSISRRLGEEGKVLLKVRVAADGTPLTVDLEKSSNFSRLDQAALQAVGHWRFVPARLGDTPVEASVIVPIVFRLES